MAGLAGSIVTLLEMTVPESIAKGVSRGCLPLDTLALYYFTQTYSEKP